MWTCNACGRYVDSSHTCYQPIADVVARKESWQSIDTAPTESLRVFLVGYRERGGYRLRPRAVVRGGFENRSFYETWGNHEVEPPDYWMPVLDLELP